MPDEPKFLGSPPPGPDPAAPRKFFAAPQTAPTTPAPPRPPAWQRAITEAATGLARFTEGLAAEFDRARWDERAAAASIELVARGHRGVRLATPAAWGEPGVALATGAELWILRDDASVSLQVGAGLPRLPSRDEWLALRARQLADGVVVAAARDLRHPTGFAAYEYLEVAAMLPDRPVNVVRVLLHVPYAIVMTLAAHGAMPDRAAVELAAAFNTLRLP